MGGLFPVIAGVSVMLAALTGLAVIDRIYTDLAVIDITPRGFQVVELSQGVSFDYVKERTGARLLPIEEDQRMAGYE